MQYRFPGRLAGSLLACVLVGCAVGPNFKEPPVPAAAGYVPPGDRLPATTASASVSGGEAQRFVQGLDIPGQWWKLFQSPELDELIEQALARNPTLEAAQAALRQAHENVAAQRASFYPSVSGAFQSQRSDASLAAVGIPGGGSYLYTLNSAAVNVSYTLDAFGGIRRQVEALKAQAEDAGRILSVFHNRRWDADFLGLQQLIASGRLGRITEFSSRFDRYRPLVRPRWREAAVLGAGIWYDLGPHLIDQALTLFGLPSAVSADLALRRDGAQAVDDALAVLHYPGHRVVLGASCLVSGGAPRYLVHGTLGSFEKYGLDVQEDQLKAGGRPGMPDWGHDPQAGRLYSWQGDTAHSEELYMPAGDYPAYYAAVRDAIEGVAPNPVTPEQAINVMRIIEAGTLAAEQGQRVNLA